MLNRGAVIIRPGQAYIEWAAGLDNSGIVPTVEGEHTVYLIPEYDDDLHAMEILSQGYEGIFEMELAGWHLDESGYWIVLPLIALWALWGLWAVIAQRDAD